nr:hypothetical protein [Tanacetum cinerariifolium]
MSATWDLNGIKLSLEAIDKGFVLSCDKNVIYIDEDKDERTIVLLCHEGDGGGDKVVDGCIRDDSLGGAEDEFVDV